MIEARGEWRVNPDVEDQLADLRKRMPDSNTPPWVAELREQLAAGGRLDVWFDAPTMRFRWAVLPA